MSVVIVLLALVPVAVAGLLAGPIAAQALYIGIVLMTSVVRSLGGRGQLLAAVFAGLVSALGAWMGPDLWALLPAIVLVCAGQRWFTVRSSRAVAVLPATLVFYALFAPAESSLLIGLSTLVGALFVVAVAAAARIRPVPQPTDGLSASVHSVLLAVGCCLLLGLGEWWGFPRANWALLAFCLMFLPADRSWKGAARYVAATAAGAAAAACLGYVGPTWLDLPFILASAVATVALILASRETWSVATLTATVVLLGTVVSGDSVAGLGLQRTLLSFLAMLVVVALMMVARPVERALGPPSSATAE